MATGRMASKRAGRQALQRVGLSTLIGAAIAGLAARSWCSRRSCRPSGGDEPSAPSPVRVDRSEAEKTDQAALMGAAVAAVLALVLGPGAWDLPASIFGLALILLLRGYFRITPPSPTELREEDTRTLERRARRKGYALAAVAGLCAGRRSPSPCSCSQRFPSCTSSRGVPAMSRTESSSPSRRHSLSSGTPAPV